MALTAPERKPGEASAAQAGPAPAPVSVSEAPAERRTVTTVEDAFAAFDAAAPEGWRVELIEGEIRVVPLANAGHERIIAKITEQTIIRRHEAKPSGERLRLWYGVGLLIPGASPGGKAIPDLVITPEDAFDDEVHFHPPAQVLLVAEVTSRSTGDIDRKAKLLGYARAGIPQYLLIDRDADTATLFSEPEGEVYNRQVAVTLSSGKLELPEPLGFVLDTSEF
jgi:Uma2 family endonuclease